WLRERSLPLSELAELRAHRLHELHGEGLAIQRAGENETGKESITFQRCVLHHARVDLIEVFLHFVAVELAAQDQVEQLRVITFDHMRDLHVRPGSEHAALSTELL